MTMHAGREHPSMLQLRNSERELGNGVRQVGDCLNIQVYPCLLD